MRPYGVLAAVAMLVALAGCGGDGGGGTGDDEADPLELPAFDLSGDWETTDIDCDSLSGDLPRFELDAFDAEIEAEVLDSTGSRIVQEGNDLEITDLDTGERLHGTISGDQVSYSDSERRIIGDLDVDLYVESEATVLRSDLLVGTQDFTWTITNPFGTVAGATRCTGRVSRIGPLCPDEVAQAAQEELADVSDLLTAPSLPMAPPPGC